MAQPIQLDLPHSDPRVELQERLQRAPAKHAEAILAGYQMLQGLHESGALELLRGALDSKDKVLEIAVSTAGSAGSVRALRNLLLVLNMLAAIDPDVLRSFTQTTPQALKRMVRNPESPGLWRLICDFLWNKDFRHGLAAVNTMLEEFGQMWAEANNRQNKMKATDAAASSGGI